MNWKRLFLAIGIAAGLFTVAGLLLKAAFWIGNNHPDWFMYAFLVIMFFIIVLMVYDLLNIKDRPIRRGGKPNLW